MAGGHGAQLIAWERLTRLEEAIKDVSRVIGDAMMRTAMDEAIADRHRLRTAFKSWACDEELMGPTHADGGAAKKRMCLEWSNVLKQCHSY